MVVTHLSSPRVPGHNPNEVSTFPFAIKRLWACPDLSSVGVDGEFIISTCKIRRNSEEVLSRTQLSLAPLSRISGKSNMFLFPRGFDITKIYSKCTSSRTEVLNADKLCQRNEHHISENNGAGDLRKFYLKKNYR